ncbi:MAG: hypothetical protein JNL10_02725 [Verrucomicrobiales bacterium]|nr:hypothetical protein [Verrucomicrobiales bacterium]
MHPWSESYSRMIYQAEAVDLSLFSPDGDSLGIVEISKLEALRLVCLPMNLGHVYRAAAEPVAGRVLIETVVLEG